MSEADDAPDEFDKAAVFDLQHHNGLPKAIHGAIVSAIDAHGPITGANATSATKRVIAALKVHNRRIRADDSTGSGCQVCGRGRTTSASTSSSAPTST